GAFVGSVRDAFWADFGGPTPVQLQVNTPATLDLRMAVGSTSDVVNAAAEAAEINTVDASIGNAFSKRQVRQLPLGTRNVVELLSLQVGVTPTGEVLGTRGDQNNITLDGAVPFLNLSGIKGTGQDALSVLNSRSKWVSVP